MSRMNSAPGWSAGPLQLAGGGWLEDNLESTEQGRFQLRVNVRNNLRGNGVRQPGIMGSGDTVDKDAYPIVVITVEDMQRWFPSLRAMPVAADRSAPVLP